MALDTAQELIGIVGMLGDEVRRDLERAMAAKSLESAVAHLASARERLDYMLSEVAKVSARLDALNSDRPIGEKPLGVTAP